MRRREKEIMCVVHLDDHTLSVRMDVSFKEAKRRLIEAFEETYVTMLLSRNGMNVSAASRASGLSRKHLRNLREKYAVYKNHHR